MSNINFSISPQNSYQNKMLFPQYITSASFLKLEKEIFKLINYLRLSPEKYLNEFSKYFLKSELNKILDELDKLETKLLSFNTKKEITNAGNDYLDYLIENTKDKSYFNIYNVDKTCFNLRARLSKYGQRNGKIFESVIINSSCAEEIVNKLIKDEKARNMILSPNMKYIAITCGFLPKINNICTIIDIVQDFTAYKDIDNSSNNNSIQIINTIDNDENDNKDQIQVYKIDDKKNNKYCSKTLKTKNNLNNKNKKIVIDIENNNINNNNVNKKNDDKNNIENVKEIKNILEKNKNFYYNISRNNYNKKFNSTISGNSKLISPLATYKSDAYLIYNQSHLNLKSFSSMKRVNSDIFNNHICDLTSKTQITMPGNNYRNSNDNSNYNTNANINTNTNTNSNINTNNNKKYENKTFHKIEVKLKNKNKNKSSIIEKKEVKKIREKNEKENNEVNKENSEIKEKDKNEIENKIRMTNFTLKNAEFKKINNSINNDNKDNRDNRDNRDKRDNINISKIEIKRNDTSDIKNNANNNYNISFDNNSYSFFSKDNQNNPISINDNENLSIEQINNTSNNTSVLNQNKKQNSFFSHDTDINNILYQKEKNINIKKLKVNIKNKNEKNEYKNKIKKIESESITFKVDKNINKTEIINKTENLDENNNNEDDNVDENENDLENEDLYYHKNKKEIKQLIRLYNKERYEQKIKIKNHEININNINNTNNLNNNSNSNSNTNENNNIPSEGNNKKSTATFFYIKKDIIKDNKEEKKIKVYRKQKINISNSQNKAIKNNKNNIYINSSYHNIKSKNYYLPENVINTENAENNYYKINDKTNNNNHILNINNNKNINYNNINFNIYNEKKRIYSYKANRSKLFKNRSYGNVLTEDNYKNLEEKERQYLSDKNIYDTEANTIKSHKYTIKRIINGNKDRETNINIDNNYIDYADEIIKINGYKNNKKELKEIKINYLYNNKNNYNTTKDTYIYKKNKVIPEKKNSFNFYSKGFNKIVEIKPKYNIYVNTKKINHINQNGSKKKYIIPYMNYTDSNVIKKV